MSKLADEHNALKSLLKSLVVDIEAMHIRYNRFGPFDVHGFRNDQAYIEWPNLAILLAEAKQKLERET